MGEIPFGTLLRGIANDIPASRFSCLGRCAHIQPCGVPIKPFGLPVKPGGAPIKPFEFLLTIRIAY